MLLYIYINGNTKVSIFDDGTKIREFDSIPIPIHPESMDVKITNKCDGNCSWCHEKSSIHGEHADINSLLEILKGLPAGVEIACGGGNILSHPDIIYFLSSLKKQGLIANMTINQKHIKSFNDKICQFINQKLIYGIGISYSDSKYLQDIIPILSITNNIVFHVITGLNSVEIIKELNDFCKQYNKTCKVLILGYKDYGFGKNYFLNNKNAIEDNKIRWYRYLAKYFEEKDLVLSFDNLAIEQLNLKRFFTDKGWNKFFMGEEGKFSMYIDAVKQEFAISSTNSNRVSFKDIDLFGFFKRISTI